MQRSPRVLVIDDDRKDNERYCQVLRSVGYEVHGVIDAEFALQIITQEQFDAILLDMLLPFHLQGSQDFGGIEVLNHIKKCDDTIQVIVITGFGNRELATEAMAKGALDYIVKDIETEDRLPGSVFVAVKRTQLLRSNAHRIQEQSDSGFVVPDYLVANSVAMRQVLRQANRLAGTDIPLLIVGEPGVGKMLLSGVIHVNSRYASGPFIPVACGNLSNNLVELFGSASYPGSGYCVQAERGTLVLKEIQNLSIKQQQQIVNLVERKMYFPVGAKEAVNCNLRIIATASSDLELLVQQHRFWSVLYDVLSVAIIKVPPLRERRDKDDAVSIAGSLLHRYQIAAGISAEATELLAIYDYATGNINELEEILRIAATQIRDGVIQLENVQLALNVIKIKQDEQIRQRIAQQLGNSPNDKLQRKTDLSNSDSAERITILREQIKEKQRRLDMRELQAAKYGVSVDPLISNEIEDLKHDIADLERRIRELSG